ncbi:hypothetical protein [Echinicola sp. 20G]|uniref:hypothetical protein n=1 Tax=Echinicola sp. 20G TaxID=2781961 RepID=UPI0019110EA2|nr:hypothetical protein [Echinicola sp. 20G]
MKTNFNTLLAFLLIFMMTSFAFQVQAQEEEEMVPKKYENPEWKYVVLIDYKPGKFGAAQKIIKDYFIPADQKAGVPGPELELVLHSGEYDLMVIWAMEEGIEEMNWELSPQSVKWRKAFNEMVGGKEAADKIMDEYRSYVNSTTSYISLKASYD